MRAVMKCLVCLIGLTLAICVLATSSRIAPNFRTPGIPRFISKHFAQSGSGRSKVRGNSDLLIDPVLVYSTFLGGPNGSKSIDQVTTLIVDAAGNVYVAGTTSSAKFPTTAGVVMPSASPNGGGTFVAKIDSTGKTLLLSTYVPGILQMGGMALDPSGNIYVAGFTTGLTIPSGTTPFQGAQRNIGIVKLNRTATAVLNVTYLGGSGSDGVSGVAVDSAGSLYVNGYTLSNDFPTTSNALQTSLGTSGKDAFFTKLNSSLSTALYSTYLGGNSGAGGSSLGSIAVDSSMNAYIVGDATPGFPTTSGAVKATCSTDCAYLAKLNPSVSGSASLVYSTFLGEGSAASVVRVDSSKNAFVGGVTNSHVSSLDSCTNPGSGFVAEIDAAGTLPFSTCLGQKGAQFDSGVTGLALDASGILYVVGSGAGGLTLKNPIQTNLSPNSVVNSYVAAIDPSSNSLLFSSLIGGALPGEKDPVTSIGVDANGNIYAAGGAWSDGVTAATLLPQLPVFNALQPIPGKAIFCTECATSDPFIWKIAPTDAPAAALSPAQLAFPAQALGTSSSPQSVTIVDLGSAALHISNAAVTGDFSILNNCSTVTPAGGTCTIDVTFTPMAAGAQTGILTITDDSAGSPRTVQLLAVGGQGSAQLSPTSLSFANQVVGTAGEAQQVKLTNSGALPLAVSHIQADNPFSETNNCGTSVGAGGSCTISVTFAPTVAGSATGVLAFTDSASDSPQSVPLSGEAAAPGLGLGVASGSSNSAQVRAGSSATYALSIGGGGVSGTASLACTGAPAKTTCSVPATVAVSGSSATNFNVSISTTAASEVLVRPLSLRPSQWIWAFALFGIVFVFRLARQLPVRRLVWAAPLLALVLCSCGGGGVGSGSAGTGTGTGTIPTPPTGGTAAGTYTVTVTAKLGSATQSQTLTLVVQ